MQEVRVFTGTDSHGRPTQLSKTVHRGKREAQRVAAEMEAGPARAVFGGRSVSDVLDPWVAQNLDTWAPSSARDQQSRVRSLKKDPISKVPLARPSVGDVERWHTRLRQAGMGDAGVKNRHGVLRAALGQAVRWGWINRNVAGMARLRSTKQKRRTVMSLGESARRDGRRRVDRSGRRADAPGRRRLRRPPGGARRAPVGRPARRTAHDRLGDRDRLELSA